MENHPQLWQQVITLGILRQLAHNSCSRHVIAVVLAFVGVLSSLSGAQTAYAEPQYLYKTDFDTPPFVAGSPLVGQDGWSVGATPEGPLSPNAAKIFPRKPRQGNQSVLVLGENLEHQDFINQITNGYYDAIGSYRKPVNYDTKGTQTVRVSAQVRVDGSKTPTGKNFFSASVAARGADTVGGGTTGIGELALSSDGHVYGYSGDDNVPTFLTSAPVRLGAWHELTVAVDFATRHFSFFVDERSLGTFPFPGSPQFAGNILARDSLIVYTAPDTATAHKANYAARFDNFRVSVGQRADDD